MNTIAGHIVDVVARQIKKGILYIDGGKIVNFEASEAVPDQYIIPGFVDLHTHAAQFNQRGLGLDLQLLEWLNTYTFPTEMQFADPELAQRTAAFVLDQLLAHGTTTAAVFASVHPVSVDAFMREALQRTLQPTLI